MKIQQLYTKCLAQGAYYIESNGEAAIIDPLRESQPYLDLAHSKGSTIKYIFETHFHADFVSGHLDLSKKTGAPIVYGPTAETQYSIHQAKDAEVFKLGAISITVLHTPGHTPESTCYLLKDAQGIDAAIFTGDTLFIGDVGRPDLALKNNLSREDLAGMLYDSLRQKIMPLSDDIIVYPGHGAGSACGKNMSSETFDTLGNQKRTNYALRADMTKLEFVEEVTNGLSKAPQYFAKNAQLNKNGYQSIDHILNKGLRGLSPYLFEQAILEHKALVLDTREPQLFKNAFIPKALNIGIDGGFAPWVGAIISDIKQPILIVCEPGREQEIVTRLARVGYDNTIGYLQGGLAAWIQANKTTQSIESITAQELSSNLTQNKSKGIVLDVRKAGEYEAEHVEQATNLPLSTIPKHWDRLDTSATYYVHCRSGYRSMIASSILQRQGFRHIVEIKGGFMAIQKTDVKTSKFVCPNSLKKG
jgi:glyoxylase-like metal-dependent hydrolase (beta-lactamase superfamily II)/rhodanese-related sulfurtransferase